MSHPKENIKEHLRCTCCVNEAVECLVIVFVKQRRALYGSICVEQWSLSQTFCAKVKCFESISHSVKQWSALPAFVVNSGVLCQHLWLTVVCFASICG